MMVIEELNIPNQANEVCTKSGHTHTILLPAAVLTQDVGVLGSVDDASPPGGVDCDPLTPLLISEGGNTDNSSRQNLSFTKYISIVLVTTILVQ